MDGHTLKELDLATLSQDRPDLGFRVGDVGTVVFVYDGGRAYEVEFVTADGRTVGLETLDANQIEPFVGRQILHARRLTVTEA